MTVWQGSTQTFPASQGAGMTLSEHLLARATDAAAALTGWLYDTNRGMWQAQVQADHVTLSMIEQGEDPALPVSAIRVARTAPTEFSWHATLGRAVPPDQDVIPSGVRMIQCAAGVSKSRTSAHEAAGYHIGALLMGAVFHNPGA